MVLGLGTDIISIARMRDTLKTGGQPFMNKVFTPGEQNTACSHPDPAVHLATIFAAKEAIFKMFAARWESGVRLTQIEIRYGDAGEPIPWLSGTFAELFQQRQAQQVLLSLSYETDYALAVAILT